jgi:putative membrane protein
MVPVPYCGLPPSPGALLERFNLDPVLIGALSAFAIAHALSVRDTRSRTYAICGWLVAALAFVSPLCALSVSLFSARIAQHMILLLIAAPLIALGGAKWRRALWTGAAAFLVALWVWHMPTPYDATFTSTSLYWSMHITLFGSGILLWRALLYHPARRVGLVLMVGLLTSTHMGLLGAVLALARRPLFFPHFATTQLWGLTPLQDQQLGGTLMWVPGIALFLWVSIRSLQRLWNTLEGRAPVQDMSQDESQPARIS